MGDGRCNLGCWHTFRPAQLYLATGAAQTCKRRWRKATWTRCCPSRAQPSYRDSFVAATASVCAFRGDEQLGAPPGCVWQAVACGRPAITQETQFTQLYGGGKGLLAFETLDDIAEAVKSINGDYAGHCKAAYEIAAEVFEATKVLDDLLKRAGV